MGANEPDDTATEGERLAAAVQAITRVSRMLERASGELSLAEFRMLSAIADGEARATRLAARLAVGKPAVSAGVDSLVRRGYVERSRVEGDQRASALSLTAAGVDVRSRMEAEMAQRLRGLCERTGDGDELIRSLGRLGDAVEGMMSERMAEHATSRSRA